MLTQRLSLFGTILGFSNSKHTTDPSFEFTASFTNTAAISPITLTPPSLDVVDPSTNTDDATEHEIPGPAPSAQQAFDPTDPALQSSTDVFLTLPETTESPVGAETPFSNSRPFPSVLEKFSVIDPSFSVSQASQIASESSEPTVTVTQFSPLPQCTCNFHVVLESLPPCRTCQASDAETPPSVSELALNIMDLASSTFSSLLESTDLQNDIVEAMETTISAIVDPLSDVTEAPANLVEASVGSVDSPSLSEISPSFLLSETTEPSNIEGVPMDVIEPSTAFQGSPSLMSNLELETISSFNSIIETSEDPTKTFNSIPQPSSNSPVSETDSVDSEIESDSTTPSFQSFANVFESLSAAIDSDFGETETPDGIPSVSSPTSITAQRLPEDVDLPVSAPTSPDSLGTSAIADSQTNARFQPIQQPPSVSDRSELPKLPSSAGGHVIAVHPSGNGFNINSTHLGPMRLPSTWKVVSINGIPLSNASVSPSSEVVSDSHPSSGRERDFSLSSRIVFPDELADEGITRLSSSKKKPISELMVNETLELDLDLEGEAVVDDESSNEHSDQILFPDTQFTRIEIGNVKQSGPLRESFHLSNNDAIIFPHAELGNPGHVMTSSNPGNVHVPKTSGVPEMTTSAGVITNNEINSLMMISSDSTKTKLPSISGVSQRSDIVRMTDARHETVSGTRPILESTSKGVFFRTLSEFLKSHSLLHGASDVSDEADNVV